MINLNTIHYRQPDELVTRLERDARGEIRDQGAKLVAWQRAGALASKLRHDLEDLKAAAEATAETLARAQAGVARREKELETARVELVKAQERDRKAREAVPSVPMMQGSVWDPNARVPMQQSGGFIPGVSNETQAAELRVEGAKRQVQRAQIGENIAQNRHKDAEDRVRACQRILSAFEGLERPETPTLDLLWSLMEGD